MSSVWLQWIFNFLLHVKCTYIPPLCTHTDILQLSAGSDMYEKWQAVVHVQTHKEKSQSFMEILMGSGNATTQWKHMHAPKHNIMCLCAMPQACTEIPPKAWAWHFLHYRPCNVLQPYGQKINFTTWGIRLYTCYVIISCYYAIRKKDMGHAAIRGKTLSKDRDEGSHEFNRRHTRVLKPIQMSAQSVSLLLFCWCVSASFLLRTVRDSHRLNAL